MRNAVRHLAATTPALLIGLALGIAPLRASVAGNLAVSAVVPTHCAVGENPVRFGQARAAGANGEGSIVLHCGPGTSYSVSFAPGDVPMPGAEPQQVAKAPAAGNPAASDYLYKDAGHTRHWDGKTEVVAGVSNGDVQTIPVYGHVLSKQAPREGDPASAITVLLTY